MTRTPVRETFVELGGKQVPVRLYRDTRARRIILRIDDRDGDGVSVTLPRRVPLREGMDLIHEKAQWVLERLGGLPPRVAFADGASVPLGGVEHTIRHIPDKRGVVRREGAEILVAGGPEHLARRLRDWLKKEARSRIGSLVGDKAAALGRTAGRVTIRDTRSRWGSCSADGNLSFCWRLVMAPESVLDYVVAHEVAHLAEPHHGPKFWRLVETLTSDMEASRDWLRRNGEALHRYG